MTRADADLLSADLCDQAAGLERGQFSAVELVEQQLGAIAAGQGAINSYIAVDADAARAAARVSDSLRARGLAGPLEGLPVAIKDNIDAVDLPTTAGMATRRGSAAAASDSPAAAGLRAAGAIVMGKLNMHEAAMGADNDNPHFGACHNPHRHAVTPGGSSGGSAAAVAAGLCAAALGTDTMGSVRIPAAYCGVVGLKPTWGAVSTRGTVPLCRAFDHVGPVARSARDLRRLLPELVSYDPACAESRVLSLAPVEDRQLRLGVVDFSATVEIEPAVQAAFEDGLRQLLKLGHRRMDLPAPSVIPGAARRAGLLLCEAEMLVEHAQAWQHKHEAFSPLLQKLMSWAEGKSAAELVAASLRVGEARVQMQQWLYSCDVLVAPTAPQTAFAFGTPVPANQADLTSGANMAGCPALSVPLPVADGELPVGLQLVGRHGSEWQLIALAEAFQQAIAWQPALPAACRDWWPQ